MYPNALGITISNHFLLLFGNATRLQLAGTPDGTVFHCASIAASFQVDTCRLVQHSNALHRFVEEQLQSLVPEQF